MNESETANNKGIVPNMIELILESSESTSAKLSMMLDLHNNLVGNKSETTLNKLLDELRNLISASFNTEIPIAFSAIADIDDLDPSEKLEVIKDITFRALETKAEIVSRLETIILSLAEKIK